MTERCRSALAADHDLIGESGQGTLVSFVPRGEARELAIELYDSGVIVRDLPGTGWLRASCGWWTNDEDINRLVAGLSA